MRGIYSASAQGHSVFLTIILYGRNPKVSEDSVTRAMTAGFVLSSFCISYQSASAHCKLLCGLRRRLKMIALVYAEGSPAADGATESSGSRSTSTAAPSSYSAASQPQAQPSAHSVAAPDHATDPVLENFSGARTPGSGALTPSASSLPQAAPHVPQQQQQQQASAPQAATPAGGVVVTPEIIAAVMAHLSAKGGAMPDSLANNAAGAVGTLPMQQAQQQQDWQPSKIGSSVSQVTSSGTAMANGISGGQQQQLPMHLQRQVSGFHLVQSASNASSPLSFHPFLLFLLADTTAQCSDAHCACSMCKSDHFCTRVCFVYLFCVATLTTDVMMCAGWAGLARSAASDRQ